MTSEEHRARAQGSSDWVEICALDDIVPGTGVAALVRGEQIAVVRPRATPELYALSNYDPFSKAFVMSRGIVGDKAGALKIASPIFKQNFDLVTGKCLDDESVSLATYAVRVRAGRVEIGIRKGEGA